MSSAGSGQVVVAMPGLRVLVVTDQARIAKQLRARLTQAGAVVIDTADPGSRAIDTATLARPDLVLMDVRLKDDQDSVRAAELIDQRLEIPVVYLTARPGRATQRRARTAGAFGYALKPFHVKNRPTHIEADVQGFRLEHRIKQSALTHETILDSVSDGVIATDTEARIRFMNPVAERLTGWLHCDAQGQPLEAVLRLENFAAQRSQPRLVPRVICAGAAVHFDGSDCVVARGGERVPIDGGAAPVVDGLGRLVGVTVTIRDISERKDLEAALLDAIGHEQRSLGRDLHDGLGQDLTGMTLLVAALSRDARNAIPPNVAELEQLGRIAKHAVETCHSLVRGLSPIDEAQGGLIEGLRDLVRRLGELPGPDIRFVAPAATRLGLSPSAADHLYRIAQEALSNALKHAHARSIEVAIDVKPRWLRLEIGDDGIGLRRAAADGPGLGLKTMRYRANVIGAQLTIAKRARSGTCVVCRYPRVADGADG